MDRMQMMKDHPSTSNYIVLPFFSLLLALPCKTFVCVNHDYHKYNSGQNELLIEISPVLFNASGILETGYLWQ